MPERAIADLRVLVVDDQDTVRTYVRRVLGLVGVTQVTEAASGHRALAKVTEPGAHFDFILCDLRMPDGDGVETIQALGRMGLKAGVAIMSVEDERLIVSAGALAKLHGLRLMGVIPKPVTVDKLKPMLVALLARAEAVVPSAADVAGLDPDRAFETGELVLHYQPSIQLSDSEPYGVEATVLWQHPTLGACAAESFVPALQATPELAARLTRAMLREAVRCSARRTKPGHPARVAIDLGLHRVNVAGLGEEVAALCGQLRVPTEAITLEVSERQLAADPAGMLEALTRFRLSGLRISLDVFTTEGAALPDLPRLPFTQLRLAAGVVHGCAKSPTQRALIESAIKLAHAVQMQVTAAGVERRDDCELLHAAGCDLAQGAYFARPMVEAGLDAWTELWDLRRLGD